MSVSRLTRRLNSMIERKHVDTNLTQGFLGGVDANGTIVELTAISQGDTEVQREGIQVNLQSIKLDLQLNYADTFNKLRVIMFKWFDNTNPSIGDLLNGSGFTNFIQAPYNWVTGRSKYKVLMDVKTLTTSVDKPVAYIRRRINLRNSKLRFLGSSATSGEWGRIFLFICSDSAVLTHPVPTGVARLVYTDL